MRMSIDFFHAINVDNMSLKIRYASNSIFLTLSTVALHLNNLAIVLHCCNEFLRSLNNSTASRKQLGLYIYVIVLLMCLY